MTANKHTPAPWIVKFRGDGSSYISMGDPLTGPHKQADLFLSVDGGEADMADARLIAAAPELLEALSMAFARLREIEISNDISVPHKLRETAREAIAKATGGAA